MVTAVFIGQVGNGGAAMKAGSHASQKGGGGGADSAPVAPDGVEVVELDWDGEKERKYHFGAGGNDVTVKFYKHASGEIDVDFTVNSSFDAGAVNAGDSRAIQTKISSIFRADVASRSSGSQYKTSAWDDDGRGGFREAMYARAGFSLGGGVNSRPGGSQYGVVRAGQLIPATRDGKPFTAAQQRAHKAATRNALRDGIRSAKKVIGKTHVR